MQDVYEWKGAQEQNKRQIVEWLLKTKRKEPKCESRCRVGYDISYSVSPIFKSDISACSAFDLKNYKT